MELPAHHRCRSRVGFGAESPSTAPNVDLKTGELSDWVKLDFKAIPGMKVSGLTRMMLTEADEHVSLYMSPINIEPGKPAMPISHPSYYSSYLEKKIGPFATLGLAEDTWALNEKVTDDGTFWTQTQDVDDEREQMLDIALDKLRSGALVTVFDATDRVNHMYWRYIEDGHPAAAGIDDPEYADAIEKQYIRNDGIVGRVLEKINDDDVLFVLSDHGCTSFRRGVNLNAWLLEGGLSRPSRRARTASSPGSSRWTGRRPGPTPSGLVGIFLNIRGREAQGIVEPGDEAKAVKTADRGQARRAWWTTKPATSPSTRPSTPTLSTADPTRATPPICSWATTTATGSPGTAPRAWSPARSSRTTSRHGAATTSSIRGWSPASCCATTMSQSDDPHIVDLAPTVLTLFGVRPAAHMDGTPLLDKKRITNEAGQRKCRCHVHIC